MKRKDFIKRILGTVIAAKFASKVSNLPDGGMATGDSAIIGLLKKYPLERDDQSYVFVAEKDCSIQYFDHDHGGHGIINLSYGKNRIEYWGRRVTIVATDLVHVL